MTATLLHDHVLDVLLDDVLPIIIVQHGHGSQQWAHNHHDEVGEGAVAPHAVVDDCRVRRGMSRRACYVAGALTLTVVRRGSRRER